ncbi:hypothetical protein HF521_015585 [Silurus meridionalis]|uniref:MAGUK p55 subfamily member 6 n=1 Tax=Silurus meridionalis TaxID=175797 RepID=A0A8T0A510_SILME|nr:hypothetical protein HF521_015585 [Silurus meridionalis]
MQQVLGNLKDLSTSTKASDLDLLFLKGIMESPVFCSLAQVHENLEDLKLEAVQDNNVELVSEILGIIRGLTIADNSAAELSRILRQPHFQSLLEAHDMVASKCYQAPPPIDPAIATAANNALMQPNAVRMIGIHKRAGESLGVTFRVEKEALVITRILYGGLIDRQGLLHVGDIIKEVNGQQVGNNPTELQKILKDCSGGITFKILPSYIDSAIPPWVYVKPHFDYNPANDILIPCREAGLTFKKGDVLQIVNREDLNWWQACNKVEGTTGLIPSQLLEEKRKAFVPKNLDTTGILCGTLNSKMKKKKMYITSRNAEFDHHELQVYEEVACVPPFQRRTVVLIGAKGVGRRSLKKSLLVCHPDRYGTTVPFTSRRPREDEHNGQTYQFVTRKDMELGGGHGRTCILDVNPQALKVLRTAEFMPYVVFIATPELETLKVIHKAVVDAGILTKQLTDVDLKKRVDESAYIQQTFQHYFDLTIVNDNFHAALETLQAALDRLYSEPQWVPVNWVY